MIIFLISLFFYNSDDTIDINVYDTYFIIALSYLMILISIILSFIGFIYYLHFKFEIPQIKYLSKVHTVITIGCIAVYFIGSLFQNKDDFPLFDNTFSFSSFLVLIVSIGVVIQFVFIFNSLFSIAKYIFIDRTKNM